MIYIIYKILHFDPLLRLTKYNVSQTHLRHDKAENIHTIYVIKMI